jgi:hypothetical protein
MARRKDLTALAALGTLGYMLSKRGDKKDDKKGSVTESQIRADRDATDQKTSGDTEDMFIEPGSGPHDQQFRDELPSASAPNRTTVSPPKKPAKPSSAKPASGAAKNLTASESQAARNALGEGSYRQDSVYNADKKGITSETRVPRFTPNEPPVQTHFGSRDEENAPRGKIDVTKYSLAERNKMKSERAPTDYRPVNERFKRGGKVKRMASGGMTSNVSSASKRADGIATKGKTRGKIC